MKFNQLSLGRYFITEVAREHERKLVLEILKGEKDYVQIAEQYEEFTMSAIAAIFHKWKNQAHKKMEWRDEEEIDLKDWIEAVKSL